MWRRRCYSNETRATNTNGALKLYFHQEAAPELVRCRRIQWCSSWDWSVTSNRKAEITKGFPSLPSSTQAGTGPNAGFARAEMRSAMILVTCEKEKAIDRKRSKVRGFSMRRRAQRVHRFALFGRILGDGRVLGCYNSDLRSRLKNNVDDEIMI
jgi:hypothetical protein